MVDIHCHILPEVDDGAKSWEVAVEMCRVAAEDGITHIVASPHANDEYHYDREWLSSVLDRLRQMADTAVEFSLGCDFHFSFENLQDLLVRPDKYVIGDTGYLLVEFSDFAISPQVTPSLYRLLNMGVTPVITHPERNVILQKQPELVLQWADAGCVVQVTANSLTGRWGDRANKSAQWLLSREAVHVLATDAHNLKSRPPVLSAGRDAAAAFCGQDVAQALVQDNPLAVVTGKVLPYFPKPVAHG
jgi:protein-tyrosine phosphatase